MDLQSTISVKVSELEHLFAGAVMTYPETARNECGWLDPAVLRDERIRRYWEAVRGGKEPTLAAFEAGIPTEVLSWATNDLVFQHSNPATYATALQDENWLYALAAHSPDLFGAVASHDVGRARLVLQEMASAAPVSTTRIASSDDLDTEFVASLQEQNVTIKTMVSKIDRALGGLWRKNSTVICARPSVGKTALAWQIARNVAKSGSRVLFVSLEMSKMSLWARAVCGSLRIPYSDVLNQNPEGELYERVVAESRRISEQYGGRLYVDDRTNMSTSDIWKQVSTMRPDMVLVDHVRLLSDKGESEVKRQGLITWNLKQIAREFDLAMVALAQLNRNLEKREKEDREPRMADLRDSGEIEENADFVLGLHRERVYLDQPREKSPASILVLKFRDGPADLRLRMEFDGLAQWFIEPGGMQP